MTILAFHIANNGRGAERPAATPSVISPAIDVSRLPLSNAACWQMQIMTECRRQRKLTPSLPAWLKAQGLMTRCVFLSSDEPGEPLIFRYIGTPTLSVLGRAWGRANLNRPTDRDPHAEFAHRVGTEYTEAISAGEAVFNRVSVTGMGQPFVYTHALYGWESYGRRAILSAVDLHTIH